MSNDDVIAGLLARDDAPIEWMYAKACRGYCVNYALKHIIDRKIVNKSNRRIAEELFDDAVVILVGNVQRQRLSTIEVKLTTYLCSIMKYRYWNERKKVKKPPLSLESSEVNRKLVNNAISEAVNQERRLEARRLVYQHLSKLDPGCRKLLTLRFLDGLPYKEIHRLLGKKVSLSAIRMQTMRCRRSLLDLIIKDSDKTNNDDA